MSTVESLLKYVQHSERLTVVTLTLTITGLLLWFAEAQWQLDLSGLPQWARPAAIIVWTISAVHVAIRAVMALWSGATATARLVADIPQRRRRTAYERLIIERLLATEGLQREMLCYALYRDYDHIWVRAGARPPRWLLGLKQNGLVEVSDASFDTVHFRIHRVAWAYMQRHPDKFINLLAWPDLPWTLSFDEAAAENEIHQKARRRG
jgi:hypothetical protein